jgi:Ca2+-binding EF-hand superfamily protein
MSSISSVGSAKSAWADMSSSRASAMKERMFAKADADGNGGVDKAELQSLLDKISKKTGTTAADAQTQLSKMDGDGNGSLSKDELDTGMKSLMPPPKSTVEFAQQHSADKDAAVSELFSKLDADGSGGLDATELKSLTDKSAVDGANASGSASSLSAEADAAVFKALDTDGDHLINKEELSTAVSGQGDGQQMRPSGPPPGPAPGGRPGGGGGGGASSSSNATDPLDTNEDGVVSAQERAAGAMKDIVQELITAMDSDGDGSISNTEAADFKTQMSTAFRDTSGAASSSSATTSTSSSSSSSSSSFDSASTQGGRPMGLDLSALRDLVRQEYGKAAANYASTSTVSLAA